MQYLKIFVAPLLTCFIWTASARAFEQSEAEDTLRVLFQELNSVVSPEKKIALNNEIINILEAALIDPDSFDQDFESLASLGRIASEDNRLRIYTWNYSETPADHKYFGFLQMKNKGSEEINLYFLDHKPAGKDGFTDRVFTHRDWYGAVYYQVHSVEHNDMTYYTLIGFDVNNILTNIKLVDILTVIDGTPFFGAPLFRSPQGIKHRIVFEYSSMVVMFLRYLPDLNMIVFDHLSPVSQAYKGQYRYYGPDFSYDALRFSDGYWNLLEDIDWRP